jgi:hypothetical protein
MNFYPNRIPTFGIFFNNKNIETVIDNEALSSRIAPHYLPYENSTLLFLSLKQLNSKLLIDIKASLLTIHAALLIMLSVLSVLNLKIYTWICGRVDSVMVYQSPKTSI